MHKVTWNKIHFNNTFQNTLKIYFTSNGSALDDQILYHKSSSFSGWFRVHGRSDMKSQQEQTQVYTDIYGSLDGWQSQYGIV